MMVTMATMGEVPIAGASIEEREPGVSRIWTRRAFVVQALSLGASVAIGGPAARALGSSLSAPEAELALGIQSFTLRQYALEPMLDVLVSLGIRQVELIPELEILFYRLGSHLPVTDDATAIDRVVQAIHSRGIRISASGVHSISDVADAERLFAFAERAGIPLLTISPDDGVLDALDRLCREHPAVRLGIHNHGPWTRYDKIADLEATLAGRAANFGACVDTGHFIRSGEDPVEAVQRLGPRVLGVHLKDFEGAGFFASGRLLGDGKLDLVRFCEALRSVGFGPDRALSLELEFGSDGLLDDVTTCIDRARSAIAAASAPQGATG
jgi:sugar phosphate isomerase/epimerase